MSIICLRLTRLAIHTIGAIFLSCSTAWAGNPEGLDLGVIRWDAWVGDLHDVGLQVERSMSPSQYHNRLPFYGVELAANSVQVRATSQAIIDAEIAYAKRAGIDFWAFVWYDPFSQLDIARNLFESSSAKQGMKYAHLIGVNNTYFSTIVSDFAKPYYKKVIGNRPLLFILTETSPGYSRAQIDALRNDALNSGVANPYIVILNADTDRAQNFATSLGADATSAYVTPGSTGQNYSTLMANEQYLWGSRANPGRKVIPWVTTGWDPRPRMTNPVSWISYNSNSWAQPGTPQQIAQQLQNALNWRAGHAGFSEAPIVLMYAWNEFDEGGWICPTHSEGTARIDAIADVMRFSASSSWDSNQTARKAFDGDSATNWQSASGSFAGQWLEVNFGVESTFSQVYLSEFGNRTGYFRIQYRTGNQWRDAYSGYGIGAGRTLSFPAVTSRRARIYFDSGTYTPIIYEFQVNNAPATPNPNLSANKSYSASSQWSGGSQPPAAAFDSNWSTNWQAAAGSAFGNQWLEVNFGDVTTFNTVHITEWGNRTGWFNIEYWAGGWHTAYSGYGIGDNAQISFPSITSTAMRIRFLSGTYQPIIYEVGVYFQ